MLEIGCKQSNIGTLQFDTRSRVYTRLCGETRRDHQGLEPKGKRGWEKGENRLCATGDTQGHGPSTQKRV